MRAELLQLIRENIPALEQELTDETSLIQSGLLDSLSLFHLAMWIESKTNVPLNPSSMDPSTEWDTVERILQFVKNHHEDA